jgi:hypothetical protein
MDRRQVEYCVGLGFERLVEGLPDDELLYAREETPDKAGRQRAFARHYLEKLINIEVPVPPLNAAATDLLLLGGAVQERDVDQGDGPEWLRRLKSTSEATLQVARVAFLAWVIGFVITWALDAFRPLPSLPSAQAAPNVADGGNSVSPDGVSIQPTPAPKVTGGPIQAQQVTFESKPPTLKLPPTRRWLYWGPADLALAGTLLFGVGAMTHRKRAMVKDSPDFAKALRCVGALLIAVGATPRVIKRYQNRMRYFAARLRPALHDPDRIDSALHWLGERLKRQFVPASWFEEAKLPAIREPALILLGAIELFEPKALQDVAALSTALHVKIPSDFQTVLRGDAWADVLKGFAREELTLPTPQEVSLYETLTTSLRNRPGAHQPPPHFTSSNTTTAAPPADP